MVKIFYRRFLKEPAVKIAVVKMASVVVGFRFRGSWLQLIEVIGNKATTP
jgi:hypothetical protein